MKIFNCDMNVYDFEIDIKQHQTGEMKFETFYLVLDGIQWERNSCIDDYSMHRENHFSLNVCLGVYIYEANEYSIFLYFFIQFSLES